MFDSGNVGDGGAREHVHDGSASFTGAVRKDGDRAPSSLGGRVIHAKRQDESECQKEVLHYVYDACSIGTMTRSLLLSR